MARNRDFRKGKGMFYFHVFTNNNAIMIKRNTEEEALKAYKRYVRAGKKVEWLGMWSGKDYKKKPAASSRK